MKSDFFLLPRQAQVAAWICVGFLAFLAVDQSRWWGMREDYSFGYLVPLFVAYVIYERWPVIKQIFIKSKTVIDENGDDQTSVETRIPQAENIDSWSPALTKFLEVLFITVLILGLLSFVMGAFLKSLTGPGLPVTWLLTVGFVGLVFGMIYSFSDFDSENNTIHPKTRLLLTSMFIFPCFIWLISSPLLDFLETKLSLFLLSNVIKVVFVVFDLLALPIEIQGNVLILPKGQVGVADACSGIRSLTACLFAGSFLSAVFLDSFLKKFLLVASAMFLAFVTNIIRSLFLTCWAYAYGSDSISGKVHDITGYAVLGLTCIGLLCLLPIFNFKFTYEPDELPEASASS